MKTVPDTYIGVESCESFCRYFIFVGTHWTRRSRAVNRFANPRGEGALCVEIGYNATVKLKFELIFIKF